jgi:hypothetical protein
MILRSRRLLGSVGAVAFGVSVTAFLAFSFEAASPLVPAISALPMMAASENRVLAPIGAFSGIA